jgi:hypothetical protein
MMDIYGPVSPKEYRNLKAMMDCQDQEEVLSIYLYGIDGWNRIKAARRAQAWLNTTRQKRGNRLRW